MTENRLARIEPLFAGGTGIVRSALLKQHGVCSKDVQALVRQGVLTRVKDGYYCWSDRIDEISDHLIATHTVPDAVIYSLSAASMHDMTTVIPDVIHIAVPNKGKLPVLPDHPAIEVTRMAVSIHRIGVTEIDGIPVYDRERTVCDCFKAAGSIGTDVALEILRAYLKSSRDIQKLFDYADRFHLTAKIRPYLEVLL